MRWKGGRLKSDADHEGDKIDGMQKNSKYSGKCRAMPSVKDGLGEGGTFWRKQGHVTRGVYLEEFFHARQNFLDGVHGLELNAACSPYLN